MLKAVPGDRFTAEKEKEILSNREALSEREDKRKKIVLVYYIGGITFAEIAAIRFLSRQLRDKLLVIATTQIISGNKCIEMMREPGTFRK